MSVLYVSSHGQDSDEGTANFPLKTITQALKQAQPGSIVQLGSGTYHGLSGEQFPLAIPAGVSIVGTPQSVTIQGGGRYAGAGANQPINVTAVLGDRAQIRDVKITNPNGSGLLSHTGTALIINNRLVDCQQHGVWVTGSAHPFISKNEFTENGATGLMLVNQAKGEIRQNQFTRNGYGISLADSSAPLIIDNQFTGDRSAILLAGVARPVLRQNSAQASQEAGLWAKDRAQPDMGQPQDPGNNIFAGKRYDIRNDTAAPIASAGNQFNPVRVQGQIAYLASEIPDESAVPAVLLGNVEPTPLPPQRQPPAPVDPLAGISLDSRFDDLVGHWAAPFVEAMAEKNLVKGFLDGTFQPDSRVTRAQFAALVAAAFPDLESDRPLSRFADVPANFWAARAIRQAQGQGFISGFPDGSFRPNAPLSRVQAIVALVNGLAVGSGRSQSLLVY
ncbi:MAG: DUF1565 domain-containing protein, partial [Phormidesmis sp.]